jgi:hypothetical protein
VPGPVRLRQVDPRSRAVRAARSLRRRVRARTRGAAPRPHWARRARCRGMFQRRSSRLQSRSGSA